MARKRDSNKLNSHQYQKRYGKLVHDDGGGGSISDNDSVLNDAASVTSAFSSTSQRYDLDEAMLSGQQSPDFVADDGITIDDGNDNFAIKLSMALEELQSTKALKVRLCLYDLLAKTLITRYCDDCLENRKLTLQDTIEHGLKRLNDEAGSSALVLSLTLITMGDSIYCDELFRSLYGLLERILIDPSAKPLVRSRCATALSLGCFITDYGMEKINELMSQLLLISFSSIRGHPDVNQLASVNSLKANCLNMFNFLATISDESFITSIIGGDMNKLIKCLESNCLELRIATGECLAFLYENSLERGKGFNLYSINELREKLSQLATDSHKSRSKKELRAQRSNFRQILRTIEGDSYSPETIKFGNEKLVLDSWKMKRYYDTFCSVLGSGMNLHLSQNPMLRDIFDLGQVSLDQVLVTKATKMEAKYLNNAKRKNREMNRSKMRGKREDFDY